MGVVGGCLLVGVCIGLYVYVNVSQKVDRKGSSIGSWFLFKEK